jgi:hypothetical protein
MHPVGVVRSLQTIDDLQTLPAVNATGEGPVIDIDDKVFMRMAMHGGLLKDLLRWWDGRVAAVNG